MPLPFRRFRVISNDCPTPDICRVILEPADGQPMFEFQAGQFVRVHLLGEDESSVHARSYSIASAPVESRNSLELGVKKQGRLSGELYQAKLGDIFGLQGPFGRFTIQQDAQHIVLFAGGIGISPFRSMLRERVLTKIGPSITLYYVARTLSDLAYHLELESLVAQVEGVKYVPVLTRECPSEWLGECGHVNAMMIEKHVEKPLEASYMFCGPDAFMDGLSQTLVDMGVKIDERLHLERF